MNNIVDINFVKYDSDEFLDIVYDDIRWYYNNWWASVGFRRMDESYREHIEYSGWTCKTLLRFEE